MTNGKSMTAQEYLDKHAQEIDKSLTLFHESATLFSAPDLIDQFENKWIAAHDGEIVAVADTIETLLALMSSKGVQANESMVRHIDREQKTFIL
jgi:hypothetical protein